MRKLNTEKLMAQKRKRNATIISILMLMILLVSTAGFAFLSNERANPEDINVDHSGREIIEVGGRQSSFQYSAAEVANVSVDVSFNSDYYSGKTLYIAADKDTILGEISLVLGPYADRIQRACYLECDEDMPEKMCDEETDERIIVWVDSDNQGVYEMNGCVFIEGDLRAVDAFLFEVLGVPRTVGITGV